MNDEWNPWIYSKNCEIQHKYAMLLINQELSSHHKNILDIGCGDGALTAYLSKKLKPMQIFGIDQCNKMIQYAQKHYPNHRYPNLYFECINAESMPKYKNKYELICSFSCLHWVEKLEEVFKSIYYNLTTNGKFVALLFQKPEPLWSIVNNLTKSKTWNDVFSNYQIPYIYDGNISIYKLLTKINFKNIKFANNTATKRFTNTENLITHVAAWLPHFRILTPQEHKDFAYDLAKKCQESSYYLKQDNTCEYTFNFCTFTASKSG